MHWVIALVTAVLMRSPLNGPHFMILVSARRFLIEIISRQRQAQHERCPVDIDSQSAGEPAKQETAYPNVRSPRRVARVRVRPITRAKWSSKNKIKKRLSNYVALRERKG